MMKRVICSLLFIVLACSLSACTGGTQPRATYTPEANKVLSNFDKNNSWTDSDTAITLADGASKVNGTGAEVNGDAVTVTKAGTYVFSGSLSNGRIVVSVPKTDKVQIVLNGVTVINNETAPFFVESADKVSVTLSDGSVNHFSDTARPIPAEGDVVPVDYIGACLYSSDDITFNGTGTLTVEAANNGIGSKNDLTICGGTITVTAANNGIKGKDSVVIAGGTINVTAGKDGVKSDNLTEAERGRIHVCGGTLTVQATDDGLQAVTEVLIEAGSVKLTVGDDKINCDGSIIVTEGCLTE